MTVLSESTWERLVCPACFSKVVKHDNGLLCTNPGCDSIYPIINGIPILISDRNSLFSVDDYGEDIESISWVADPEAGVETIFDRKQTSERLLQALDELPVNYRSILTLIDLYELDYSEATQILNIPIGTVKSRLSRARLHMQNKIKSDDNIFISKTVCAIAV